MLQDSMNIKSFFAKGNLLFLGCHLDDIEYGCGGFINRLVEAGLREKIYYLTLSKYNKSADGNITIERDLDEVYQATSLLGLSKDNIMIQEIPGQLFQRYPQEIREILLNVRREFAPDYVFFPSKNDIHQDHHTLYEEALRIFRNQNCFGYELIRSSYHFQPNLYLEIGTSHLERKTAAVMVYQSQITQSAGYYFDPDIIRSVALFRGGQAGKKYAEAYEIYFLYL